MADDNIVEQHASVPAHVAAGLSAAAAEAEPRSLLLDLPGPALQSVLRYAGKDGTPGSCSLARVCSSLRSAARQLSSKLVVHFHINELLQESQWRIQTIRATTPTLLYQPALAAAADALEDAQEQHQQQEAAAYAKAESLGTWLLQYAGCVECLRVTIKCSQGFLPTQRLDMPVLRALQAAATAGGAPGPQAVAAAAAAAGGGGSSSGIGPQAAAAAAAGEVTAGAAAAASAGVPILPAAGSSRGSDLPLRRLQLPPLLTTPAAAQALACCRQLQELSLTLHFSDDIASATPITPGSSSSSSTGGWCGAFQQLSALQRVALVIGRQPRHTQQLEQLLQHLPGGVQALDLTYPSFVGLSSSSITHLGVLRTLRLSGVQFTRGTPQQLGRLTALTALEHAQLLQQLLQEPCDTLQTPVLEDLYVTTISTSCLQQLQAASCLRGLHVSLALPKYPGVLGALRPLKQLQRLRLGKLLRWPSEQVAAQGWGEVLSGLSQLRELQLPQRLLVASRGGDWLAPMQKLRQLEVSFYDVQPTAHCCTSSFTAAMAAAMAPALHGGGSLAHGTAAPPPEESMLAVLVAAVELHVAAALQEVRDSKVQLQGLTFVQFKDNPQLVRSVEAAMAAVCPGVQCRCVPSEAVVSPCQVLLG